MIAVLLIIVGLVAGYFFLKYYKQIDHKLFSSMEGYQPFGLKLVYLSAILGAIMGCFVMFAEDQDETFSMFYGTVSILAMMGVFQTFLYLKNPKAIAYKALFSVGSCLLAMVIGAMASVVLICLVIIWFILAMAGHATMDMLSGGIGKKKRTDRIDENGKRIQVTDLGNGDYEGVGGERYRDCGSHIERL